MILTLYVDDVLLLVTNKLLLNKLNKQMMHRFKMTSMGDMSRVLGINVARNREKGTITINKRDSMEDVIERFGIYDCKPMYTPGVGPELSLNQPEETLLDEEDKKRYQSITGAIKCLRQVSSYDILFAVNLLARAMPKPSKAHMGAVKHLLLYLAGSVNFSIAYERGGFKLAAYSDANWGSNPDNARQWPQ